MSEHPYSDRDFLTLRIGANIELSRPDFPTRYVLNKNTLSSKGKRKNRPVFTSHVRNTIRSRIGLEACELFQYCRYTPPLLTLPL